MSRTVERNGFSDSVRIAMLEADEDRRDKELAEFMVETRAALKDIYSRMNKILWAMMSLLITIATGTALFALQVAAGK